MSDGATNTLWARTFVDELARAGVGEVVLAPGSRSTPLVMAFAQSGRFRLRVHLDERSAGFFALGVGKASGLPAAVVTTSGTATANLLPAIVEAAQSETPMLVLTADRPHRLRDADANQAIDQLRLYGPFARAFFEVGPPSSGDPELRHLRGLADRAVSRASAAPAGPVHLNFPFDKPLEPEELSPDLAERRALVGRGRPEAAPFVEISSGHRRLAVEALDELAGLLDTTEGVIVAGPSPDPRRTAPAVLDLAARTGYPVLADPLSGARFGASGAAQVVAGYDLILRDEAVRRRLRPSVVLRVGPTPTSASLQTWLLEHAEAPYAVIDAGGRWKDHGASVTHYFEADPVAALREVGERVAARASVEWCEAWKAAERGALGALRAPFPDAAEGDVWGQILAAVPDGSTVFVSSSMPVRDLDAFGLPCERDVRVLGNRGASGIDGIVSTAFGVASQCRGAVVCVIGDLALFHDQNGLLWSREDDAPVVFVLLDNDGGAIFHTLPIAGHEPHFTRYFATPHGLDFAHAARMHGLSLEDVSVSALAGPLSDALRSGRSALLRVPFDREAAQRERNRRIAVAAEGAREALAGG